MGYPHDTKIDQSNAAMFQSVHRTPGPSGLISFLSLILTHLCTWYAWYFSDISLQELFDQGFSGSVVGVLASITFAALFAIVMFLTVIVGAIEGSNWAGVTLALLFLPAVVALFWAMSISGTALFHELF